ncbi:MAG: GNAT family N-acetyltransferase [Coleofasciculus sp. B1-GNL1-01]|uniref:N-acetyltransferase family protein n=1 Tax=Coleofasciculus sp. B1-GNL1-01 TaxID=3068484 RepID=UPI003303BC41
MNSITRRPYRGEIDLDAIANLINTCETVDQLEEGTSVTELQQSFDDPFIDKERDLFLWQDADDQLIGFGRLWIVPTDTVIDGFLGFRVHPTARSGDLQEQIITWAEERLRQVSQERGLPVNVRCGSRADQTDRITILERCGFKRDRYFFTMTRSLQEPIPEPKLPDGFTLGYSKGKEDVEAYVELYNQTFIDHWNYHELTVERILHELQDPYYKPELSLLAMAPDGTYAAFCYCRVNPEENQRNGRSEGEIAVLGTRRGFRKQGLGRAMLLAGMQQLKAAGVETAKLGVDAKNLSGALRLYESVGFSTVRTHISLVKQLQAVG